MVFKADGSISFESPKLAKTKPQNYLLLMLMLLKYSFFLKFFYRGIDCRLPYLNVLACSAFKKVYKIIGGVEVLQTVQVCQYTSCITPQQYSTVPDNHSEEQA